MQYCWDVTAGCVLIAAPTALSHPGRQTIAFLASWSYFTTPRQACPCTPSTPPLRVEASISATKARQASPCLTILNSLRIIWLEAMGHYLVDMMPQSDLPAVEEHFVASGRQVLPLVGVATLEPGDILGVAHASLLSVPLDVLHQNNRAPSPPSGLSEVAPVSVVTTSPLAAPTSPSPALLEHLSPAQRVSFLDVWERCPCICRRCFFTFTAWTGPLRSSNSWGMFSAISRTFSRSPNHPAR